MKVTQQLNLEQQIRLQQEKLTALPTKLQEADEKSRTTGFQDWSARYGFWSQWEDVEELNESLSTEKTKLSSLREGSSFMGHYHDHGEG